MTIPEQAMGQPSERSKRGAKNQPPVAPVDTESLTRTLSVPSRSTLEQLHETEKETESRLRIKEDDAVAERLEKKAAMDHRRKLEFVALAAYVVICGIVLIACLGVLADKSIAPPDKAWIGPTLTLIIGGLLGFLTGRSSGRSVEK